MDARALVIQKAAMLVDAASRVITLSEIVLMMLLN